MLQVLFKAQNMAYEYSKLRGLGVQNGIVGDSDSSHPNLDGGIATIQIPMSKSCCQLGI